MDLNTLDRKAHRLTQIGFVRLPEDTPQVDVDFVVNQAMILDDSLASVSVTKPYGPYRYFELRRVEK